MGYFLTKFRKDTLALHIQVENKAYIDRYKDEGRNEAAAQPELQKRYQGEHSLTPLDHYRHLCQMLPIYEILEKKIADINFSPPLPTEPANLIQTLKQADKIRNDIQFLAPYIHGKNQNIVLETTQKYVDTLASIKITKDENANELLAHYLVRILGDLFGGQKIQTYINSMYERHHIPKTTPNDGVNFCTFDKDTLITLINWLNGLLKDDRPNNLIVIDEDPQKLLTAKDYEQIAQAGNAAFKTHIELYEELEQSRAGAAKLDKEAIAAPSIANNSSGFFNSSGISTVATAGAAVLATGIVLAGIYFNRSS